MRAVAEPGWLKTMRAAAVIMAAGLTSGVAMARGGMQSNDTGGARPKHPSTAPGAGAVLSATDPDTGIKVSVDPDGTTVRATDKAGAELWRGDVVKAVGAPAVGAPAVRSVSIGPDHVVVLVLGKQMVAQANLRTGAMWLGGEN